jgi:hypothetical protein
MAILVLAPPTIIPVPVCPGTWVKVVARNGYKLRVRSYDMISNQQLGETTYDITSDVWETVVTWAVPEGRGVVMAVLEVVDQAGNVVEKWSAPFIHVPNATRLDLPSSDYEVVYMSKVFAVTVVNSKVDAAYLDDMLITLVRRSGYLALYDGTRKVLEVTGKSAIIPLVFIIRRDVARALANYIDREEVARVVYKVPELADIIGAVALIKQICESVKFTNFSVTPVFPSPTDEYIKVYVTFYADLQSPLDWWGIVKVVAGIGAIVAGGILILASLGTGAPLGVYSIIGGLSLVAGAIVIWDTAVSENPMPVRKQAEIIVETALAQMKNYRDQLEQYLNQLVSQGKITSDEKSVIMSYVDSIIGIAETALRDLQKLVDTAYESGKASMYPWVVVAWLVGVVMGSMLARRGS